MDDPWQHVPPLDGADAAPRRRREVPDWAVAPLVLISVLLLAFLPIIILGCIVFTVLLSSR